MYKSQVCTGATFFFRLVAVVYNGDRGRLADTTQCPPVHKGHAAAVT